MKPLVAVVGPTGVGKTDLALDLAEKFHGEIVSADSRQVYRFMDIGTAKPDAQQLGRAQHHLIDLIDPDGEFSLALYQKAVARCFADIHRRNRLPLLVGGSGLYVRSVLEGWQTPQVSPDKVFRERLQARAAADGGVSLFKELQGCDPEGASRIDRRNLRRVIRALEVCQSTGIPFSQWQKKITPDLDVLIIGLTAERGELYRRVDRRVDDMLARGLVSEVEGLLARGYGADLPSMSGLGYRQIMDYLAGRVTLEGATERIKCETHRFVRHQYAWFHLDDKRIRWFNIGQDFVPEVIKTVSEFLERSKMLQTVAGGQ